MIHVAAFSGGKDSTALLLWLQEQGIEFTAVFCDTGWEHPLTYAYLEEINQRLLGGHLVTVRNPKWEHGMTSLVARKGRVPSSQARFCTEELKVFPMRDYLRSLDDEATVYLGVRAEESASRAAMLERDWSDVYDCWVERPLIRWKVAEVFACLDRHGIAANPLYKLGSKRVGCFPCIMTNHGELRRLSTMLPELWDRIATLEAAAGRSFFPPEYIPTAFCSRKVAAKRTRTVDEIEQEYEALVGLPTVEDVRRYVSDGAQRSFWDDGEPPSCMSVYNLCE